MQGNSTTAINEQPPPSGVLFDAATSVENVFFKLHAIEGVIEQVGQNVMGGLGREDKTTLMVESAIFLLSAVSQEAKAVSDRLYEANRLSKVRS